LSDPPPGDRRDAPEGHQGHQDAPEGHQDAPEGHQGHQDAPEGHQDAPEGHQGHQELPEGHQELPEGDRTTPGRERGSIAAALRRGGKEASPTRMTRFRRQRSEPR
jgi:hypothetical protein